MYAPGKTPSWPFTLPVHQSSALSVFLTNSILSPAEKDKSPAAWRAKRRVLSASESSPERRPAQEKESVPSPRNRTVQLRT